jgi:hypothetical protein
MVSTTVVIIPCHIVGLEKKLTVRQLTVKADSSNSCFICINNILRKYDMKEASTYLESPMSKSKWSSVVKSKVREYWSSHIHRILFMHMNQLLLESAFTVNWRTANFFSMLDSSWWQTLLKNTNALRCIWASIQF